MEIENNKQNIVLFAIFKVMFCNVSIKKLLLFCRINYYDYYCYLCVKVVIKHKM